MQADEAKTETRQRRRRPAQYELAKLHLPQAHALAKGDKMLVAVIDSGVDVNHPELAGAIAETYDTLAQPLTPHKHGTAIAGLIAAHGKLMGAAPGAHILAIRAFNPTDKGADGTTFNILKGLDWAAAHDARVINMSFAGPADPAIHRSLEAAHKKGIVLVAAAGNAGAKSPPLYPAADPNVIAVTATDADDKLFEQSNRGPHIAVAAPGAQILVATPDGAYEVSSGTSYSAAEVSGIVALMLERKGDLTPDNVRDILMATAKDLGPKGRDPHVRRRPGRRLWRAHAGAGASDGLGAAAGRARQRRRALNPLAPARKIATCEPALTFRRGHMAANDQPPAMPLRVTRNDKIADGIHLFEFRDADGKPLPEFSAGAHIAIHVPSGLLRKYSLCNDPAERDRYLVAVKREANGRGGSSQSDRQGEGRRHADGGARRSTISACRSARRIFCSSPAASASRRSWR